MEFREIKDGYVTLEIDPDDAALLAAACRVAGAYLQGSVPTVNPFDTLGEEGLLTSTLAAYRAVFDAGMTASVALFNVPVKEIPDLTLTALRLRGPGWNRAQRDVPSPAQESESGDAV